MLYTSQTSKERSPSKAHPHRAQPFHPVLSKFISILNLLDSPFMLVPYVLFFSASQTLLFLYQSLYSSPAVLSLQANQSLSFVKSCPICLHFLLIYSHLPLPSSPISLSCSNSSGSLSFQSQFFKHNHSSITFSSSFVQKAPAPVPLMKYVRSLSTLPFYGVILTVPITTVPPDLSFLIPQVL